MQLEPEKLVMKDDDLYIQDEEILIKLHVKDWFS